MDLVALFLLKPDYVLLSIFIFEKFANLNLYVLRFLRYRVRFRTARRIL